MLSKKGNCLKEEVTVMDTRVADSIGNGSRILFGSRIVSDFKNKIVRLMDAIGNCLKNKAIMAIDTSVAASNRCKGCD